MDPVAEGPPLIVAELVTVRRCVGVKLGVPDGDAVGLRVRETVAVGVTVCSAEAVEVPDEVPAAGGTGGGVGTWQTQRDALGTRIPESPKTLWKNGEMGGKGGNGGKWGGNGGKWGGNGDSS